MRRKSRRRPARKTPVAIERTIRQVRGQTVTLDADLAALYGVEPANWSAPFAAT